MTDPSDKVSNVEGKSDERPHNAYEISVIAIEPQEQISDNALNASKEVVRKKMTKLLEGGKLICFSNCATYTVEKYQEFNKQFGWQQRQNSPSKRYVASKS